MNPEEHVAQIWEVAERFYYHTHGNSVYCRKERKGPETLLVFEEGLTTIKSDYWINTRTNA